MNLTYYHHHSKPWHDHIFPNYTKPIFLAFQQHLLLLIYIFMCIRSKSPTVNWRNFQVQLIRIQLRVPEHGWTTQKVFHLMNFIVNGCKDRIALVAVLVSIFCIVLINVISFLTVRAVLFGLYEEVFLLRQKVCACSDFWAMKSDCCSSTVSWHCM